MFYVLCINYKTEKYHLRTKKLALKIALRVSDYICILLYSIYEGCM